MDIYSSIWSILGIALIILIIFNLIKVMRRRKKGFMEDEEA
jgi:uncharacterized membrane protein